VREAMGRWAQRQGQRRRGRFHARGVQAHGSVPQAVLPVPAIMRCRGGSAPANLRLARPCRYQPASSPCAALISAAAGLPLAATTAAALRFAARFPAATARDTPAKWITL
jgi:hypothetical protein